MFLAYNPFPYAEDERFAALKGSETFNYAPNCDGVQCRINCVPLGVRRLQDLSRRRGGPRCWTSEARKHYSPDMDIGNGNGTLHNLYARLR